MRRYFHGTLVAAGGYDVAAAQYGITTHLFDLAAFGRPFIANPDLIVRLQRDEPLVKYDDTMLAELY
jgi:N-ethylmaleimide reductase